MNVGGSAPRTSQLSGSTAFNSTTSLTSLSSATTVAASTPGQIVPTSNIINQKADASRSLYQICVLLKQRLAQVPGFEEYMQQLDEWATDVPDGSEGADGGSDGGPVGSLWRLLRTGHPLLTIYNALQPEKPLHVDESMGNESKRSKIAIANFVRACLNDVKPPPSECFIINDLTGNDTTGFVKVTCPHPKPAAGGTVAVQCYLNLQRRRARRANMVNLPRSFLLLTMSSISPSNGTCSSRSNRTPKMIRSVPHRR